ncbi:MAG: trypsin-like peptidase domain-containing protein [Acidobacteria bacterium]|nr:trypsin-like peptidase domain-containing protein [Acidobacteriota bacterium]
MKSQTKLRSFCALLVWLLGVWTSNASLGQGLKKPEAQQIAKILKEELSVQETEKLKSVEKALKTYTPIYVDTENRMKFGSGVFVSDRRILTVSHLSMPGARYYLDEDFENELVVVAEDKDLDLMLLESKAEHKDHAALAKGISTFQEIFAIGTPLGIEAVVVFGRIGQMAKDGKSLLLDSRVTRGFSGGGVYNQRGELLGIISMAWGDEFARFMVAVSVQAIQGFLNQGEQAMHVSQEIEW